MNQSAFRRSQSGRDSLRYLRTGGIAGLLFLSRALLPAQETPASLTPVNENHDSDDVIALDAFVVTDANSLKTTLPVRPVAGVYGYDTNYQDIPRSITQINPRQFELDIISSYSDFARYSPSVNQSTGQIANYGSPTMRGSKSDAYQNGVRLLTRQQNNRPFTLNAYEAADIIAGPAPVIFGPSERTAGYVNYLTKRPYFDRRRTSVNLRFGKLYGDGTGVKPNFNWQIDTGGPLANGKLAYRVSYQGENVDSYYRNVDNRFHDVFATVAWLPNRDLTIDWNFEYGTFKWQVNNFLNRVTNDLIRDGTYLAGPATPIIQGAFSGAATGFYSPVYVPGVGFDGTKFIRRTRSGNRYAAGAALTGAPTAAQAGTIVGYVFDPALVRPVAIDRHAALNAPGFPSTTEAFNTQLRVKRSFGDAVTLVNNTLYQFYTTDTASNGGFYNWIRTHTIENRSEGLWRREYKLFGLPVNHQSNSGISYRFEEVRNYKDSQATGTGPTGDQFDLTQDPATFTRNAFLGGSVYPFAGTTATPVLTRFGYLKGFFPFLPTPESPANAVSPGGSTTGLSTATNHTWTHSLSFYTQHTLRLGEQWLLDAGARQTIVWSQIHNPLGLNPANAAIEDGIRATLPGYSASLSYKPFSRLTTYATYAYVVAQNGMTTGSPTWATVNGTPNQYNPDNFHSLSELIEIGAKFELVPGKLFSGVAAYTQTRDLTIAAVPGADPIQAVGEYEGIEANLRYQPAPAFTVGANYTYLRATTLDQNISVPTSLVADNATNILASTALGVGDWRVTNLPHHNFTLFASYQLKFGLGVKADVWFRDSYFATNQGSVTVPAEHNLNVGLFYTQPRWSVAFDLQNVTNERNFAGGSTLLEPLNVQGRFSFNF